MYTSLLEYLDSNDATLVAVSKTKPSSMIQTLYDQGQRIFGENRVQEMAEKHEVLPKDIEWHMIGHLQKNKVKYMASFVSMIHSVDNMPLLSTIDTQAKKHNRKIDILLQIKIAQEATKSGWDYETLITEIASETIFKYPNVSIRGVMGMATFTENKEQVRGEFRRLKQYFDELSPLIGSDRFDTISMGMSSDYTIAVEEGANMVRIGSLLFGAR